jgi:uncharacterized protein
VDPEISVADDETADRYVLTVDGEPAGVLVYRPLSGATTGRIFLHTQVDPAFEGRGLGSTLIRSALDDARARGFAVLPQCPFVKAYLQRHPAEADVVPAGDRTAYGLPPA